ncbi:MAG: aminoglycoside 3-N-acetyltransferase, partial [Actinobacteria bacterium]|nr:aminoglycoside 3-N-acetyltransferase [Actinomycetota bacterium]
VDCSQRAEGRYGLMRGILATLRDAANPFSILTKGTLILRDLDLLQQAAQVTGVGANVSVGFVDRDLWRGVEPGTPSPQARLAACRTLNDAGIGCGVLMAPVLPYLTDSPAQLDRTVRSIAEAGATQVTPIVLHLRPGAREWFMSWLDEHHPALVPHYRKLYGRGSYAPRAWRAHVPPFDPAASRAARDNGVLPEFLRTTPGARRSGNPGASVAALGARAGWLTADHPLDYGYGEGSPLAKLVAVGGKVVMVGAPLDTMTLLHHAEHLAQLPGKRVIRSEVPFATTDGAVDWRMVEEFDTCDPVVAGLAGDYFATIATAFLAAGQGRAGLVGSAPSVLVEAAAMTAFAVDWLEHMF